jgi:hypothetical protein
MAYFDDKEDVLGIELTPLGRTLLSKGLLKPAYYAFHDDDVLYDIGSCNSSESNYQIKNRILNETPRVRPQSNLKDLDKKNMDLNPDTTNDIIKYNLYPLGTSNNIEKETPAWKVNVLSNELISATNHLSSSYGTHIIPQLSMDIEYTLSVGNINNQPSAAGLPSSPNLQVTSVFSDGTFLKIEEEQAILQLLETNGFLHGESMQVEAFIYDDAAKERLIPLKFIKKDKEIDNDLLVDNPDQEYVEPTLGTVEYYFDIRFDKEIPETDLGSAGAGTTQDERITRSIKNPNIYKSPINPEDIEDCD